MPDKVVQSNVDSAESSDSTGPSSVEMLSEKLDDIKVNSDAEEVIEILSDEERAQRNEQATQFKNEGNRLFKNNEYEAAIESYKKGLDICPKDSQDVRVVLCSNIAAATDHLGLHEDAIGYCNEALALKPDHIKALLRRAQLFRKCDKLDESLADYQEYCKLVPDDKPAKRVVQELNVQTAERNEKLKTEMMGKLKDLGNMFLKPFGLSTENFQMVKNPESGNYSVNFNNKQQ